MLYANSILNLHWIFCFPNNGKILLKFDYLLPTSILCAYLITCTSHYFVDVVNNVILYLLIHLLSLVLFFPSCSSVLPSGITYFGLRNFLFISCWKQVCWWQILSALICLEMSFHLHFWRNLFFFFFAPTGVELSLFLLSL